MSSCDISLGIDYGGNFMASQRTTVTLSDRDRLWLEIYSRAYGISMAEAIRRGIARLRDEEGSRTYEIIVKETKGIWEERGDGLNYQKELRSEWR
jgi:hypothetical protein